MSNTYYTKSGAPATQTRGLSVNIRDEFALIEAAFDEVQAGVTTNGIIFPAIQSASTNSNTLDDYEESLGASGWTPADASGAGLAFTSVSGQYVKIGRMVFVQCALTYPATASGTVAGIGGLPFPQQSGMADASLSIGNVQSGTLQFAVATVQGTATPVIGITLPVAAARANNIDLSSRRLNISGWYIASA